MSQSQLLVLDTLDDRRELHRLLTKLHPAARLGFLKWACQQAPQGKGRLPPPVPGMMRVSVEEACRCDRADLMHANEVYGDLLGLLNDWGVDAMKLARELERRVRALRR